MGHREVCQLVWLFAEGLSLGAAGAVAVRWVMAAPAWPRPSQCCRPDQCGHALGEVTVLAASRELVVMVLLLSALWLVALCHPTAQAPRRAGGTEPCRATWEGPCRTTRDHATARGTQTKPTLAAADAAPHARCPGGRDIPEPTARTYINARIYMVLA